LSLSALLTILFWPNGAFLFLFFPFLWPRRAAGESNERTCPRCGWTTRDPRALYCPRDAEPLPGKRPGEPF